MVFIYPVPATVSYYTYSITGRIGSRIFPYRWCHVQLTKSNPVRYMVCLNAVHRLAAYRLRLIKKRTKITPFIITLLPQAHAHVLQIKKEERSAPTRSSQALGAVLACPYYRGDGYGGHETTRAPIAGIPPCTRTSSSTLAHEATRSVSTPVPPPFNS